MHVPDVVSRARSLLVLLAQARAVPDARTQGARLGEPRVVLVDRPLTGVVSRAGGVYRVLR